MSQSTKQKITAINTLLLQKEAEVTAGFQTEADNRNEAISNVQKSFYKGLDDVQESTDKRINEVQQQFETQIYLKENALVFPTIDLNTANGFSSVLYKNGAELGVKTGIKNHLHLEGEGISLNDFPFSTGAGSPSNAEFGTYVGPVFLTRWYYSYSKIDEEGQPANSSGDSGSIKFQLYENGVGKNCYLMFNGGGSEVRYFSGSFVDVNDVELNSVNYNNELPVSNYVNKPFSFKCVQIANLDEATTRHRLTIQYEFQTTS